MSEVFYNYKFDITGNKLLSPEGKNLWYLTSNYYRDKYLNKYERFDHDRVIEFDLSIELKRFTELMRDFAIVRKQYPVYDLLEILDDLCAGKIPTCATMRREIKDNWRKIYKHKNPNDSLEDDSVDLD